MKTGLKAVGIFIGVLSSCLVIVAACLFSYANTGHFRNLLLKKINASISGNLTMGGHHISFLKGRIVLENLGLKDPSGNRLVTLDYLLADIAFLPLLNRMIVIETMTLKNPDIRLTIDKNGTIDVAEALKTSSEIKTVHEGENSGIPFDVVIQDVSIKDGDFHFTAESDDFHMGLNRITIQAKADFFKKSGEIRLRVEDTKLAYGARRLEIHPTTFSAKLSEDRLESVAFAAKTDFAEIAVTGEVRRIFHDPDLNLRLAFDFSLAELSHLLAVPSEITGNTTGVMTIRGSWQDPEADLRLVFDGGVLSGYPVEGLRANLSLVNRQLAVQQIDIRAGSGEISLAGNINLQELFPGKLASSQLNPDKVGYAINAKLKHIDIAFLDKGTDRVKGFLNSAVTIEGTGIDIKKLAASGTVDASLEGFFLKGMHQPTDLQMHAAGQIKAGLIDLSQLTGIAAKTHLNARGALDMPTGHIEGRLTVDTKDIENPLALFGVTGYAGAITVKATVSGPWKQPDIKIDMTGSQIRLDHTRLEKVDLAGNVDRNGILNIASLKIVNQGTQAELNGTIQLFKEGFLLHETMPLKARIKFINAEIHDLLDYETVNGSFDGEMQIEGNVHSLQAAAVLRGKDVAYEKIFLGDAAANVRFLDGGLLLDQLRLKNQSATCLLTGDIHVFEPDSWRRLAEPVLNLDMKGDDVSIADYIHDIKGTLSLEAHLEGPMSRLKGEGYVTAEQLDFNAQRVEKITMGIELKDNRLHIPRLQAAVDQQSVVTGSGWYDFDQTFAFDLFSKDMRLVSIDKIRQMENVEGKMNFHVWGEGNIKDPSIYGDIHVKEVRINDENMDDFNLRIDLVHNQVSIKGRQTFDLNGVYHLANKDFYLDLLFSDTDLSPFFLATGWEDFGGKITGKIMARGNTASLKKSEASLDISNLTLTYLGESLIHTNRIQGDLRNQRLSIPEFHLDFLNSGHAVIKGSGNFDGYFDVTADGEIPAKSAMLFFKDVTDIQGDIRVHAEMKGPFTESGFSGEITLQEVGGALPQLEPSFGNINGKIRIMSSHVSVENLTGKLGTGTFQINGDMGFEKFIPGMIQLELKANKMLIHVPETMDVLINTDLMATGTPENLMIEGDIVILEGMYYKNVKLNLLKKITEKKRTGELPARKPPYPFFDKMKYNIRIKYREPFIVENNIAYLEIHPDLVISGTLNTPVISGSAKVHAGTLSYQNKTFVVEKGIINFANPYKIEPDIDIMGSVDIRQWRISLSLSGVPDRLVVELSSTPPEEDADILSLLIFGKTTYEIKGGNEGVIASPGMMLAQLMASSYGEDIKKTTGLDYLELETESTEAEGASDAVKVTVGKDLSERLAVKYSVEQGKNGYNQRATSEYKLLEHILLSGFQDIKGSYGGEIIFRVEFRLFQ